ncbi:MAG: hypothetical protein ACE5K2_01735 [Candidatus Zixiibacteriota bacterium]
MVGDIRILSANELAPEPVNGMGHPVHMIGFILFSPCPRPFSLLADACPSAQTDTYGHLGGFLWINLKILWVSALQEHFFKSSLALNLKGMKS